MKVLIISHNPISTINNNGKTMLTLFSSFSKEELCQLYIYPTLPDVDKCSSYFRITDKDILKSYYRFKVFGREISSSEIDTTIHTLFESKNDENLYRNKKNKLPLRLLLRDIMWRFAHWYNGALIRWIQEQKPTAIFIVPGTSKFLYDIALKISKEFDLPIISYICDDYYFVNKAKSFLGRMQQKKLKKKISVLMGKTSHIITICDELKKEYTKFFKIPATTIMTGSSKCIESHARIQQEVRNLVYMGNIRCNRFESLSEIGCELDSINREYSINFVLKIYTSEKDEEILKRFSKIDSVELCGFVSGEEFERVFRSADALVHVEAFDEDSIDLVKHSISTKIADSLSSGVCLFAYGPSQVASINYLLENDCAIICNQKEDLRKCLLQLFFEADTRDRVIEKALMTARENHDCAKVGQKVYRLISKVSDESFTD